MSSSVSAEKRAQIVGLFSKVVERIDSNRFLLDTNEIVRSDGMLLGYRVYKGIPQRHIDAHGNLHSPWRSQHEYELALRRKVHELQSRDVNLVEEKWHYPNTMNVFEQLAFCQAGMSSPDNLASSWTRDPFEAIGFAEWPSGEPGIVLRYDVPLQICVSQEALKLRLMGENLNRNYPLENRPENEKEVTVFEYIDVKDPKFARYVSSELRRIARIVEAQLRTNR